MVHGQFVVIAGGDWTVMKAGLKGTPKVENIDAINRRGVIQVKVDGNQILVRGMVTSSTERGNDVQEKVPWYDDSFGWLTSADVVNVSIVTCGLRPGMERDFVREVGRIVSEDLKRCSAQAKSCLPNFCDEDLLIKIDEAIKRIDQQGRIQWNLVFPGEVGANEYFKGVNFLLKQLEYCLTSTGKKAFQDLIAKVKEIIKQRKLCSQKFDPNTESSKSHQSVIDFWEKTVLPRLERIKNIAKGP